MNINMKKIGLLLLCALLGFTVGCPWSFYKDEPKNYAECISKNMQGITGARARILIEKACESKFPPNQRQQQ